MDLNLPQRHVFVGPARVWKRLLALLVDLSILDFFVFTFFSGAAEKMIGNVTGFASTYRLLTESSSKTNALVLMFSIIVFLMLAYFILLQYMTGQTVGCMLLELRIVSERTGTSPNFWQCVLRNLYVIPVMPFIFLWVIDPLYFFYSGKNQRLSEFLSQTKVIEQFA